jgi:redox-sensitive bicupin YhaK (pirin superfamily)
MYIRKANDRGRTEIGWLYSRHSFSFGDYYDPKHMGFRTLRVINDDIIAKGKGFGMHGHRDMEIITLVVDGALEHKDSLGHGEVLKPGEVQVMTAGSGIRHSEFNPSPTQDAHIIQIWIEPERDNLVPAYGQKEFPIADRVNRFVRVAGPRGGADGALTINQDAHIYVSSVEPGSTVSHPLAEGRAAWIHIIKGSCTVNGAPVSGGDAVALETSGDITVLGSTEPCEVIVFDLP